MFPFLSQTYSMSELRQHYPVFKNLHPMQTGTTQASDGTPIAYQSFGEGFPVILANGIGVRFPGWIYQIAHFRERYRLICWDYRGLGASRPVADKGSFSMATHAADCLAVMDALNLSQAVVVGWSMGVPVGLEMIRKRPLAIRGFVALLGSPGYPFASLFPGVCSLAPRLIFGLSKLNPVVPNLLLDFAMQNRTISLPFLKKAGFIAPNTDETVFASNMHGVAIADKHAYFSTMLELLSHSAEDMLRNIRCPVEIITGEKDYLTPPQMAREMAKQLQDVALEIIPKGSHFALIEFPDLVNTHIETLLQRAVPEIQ